MTTLKNCVLPDLLGVTAVPTVRLDGSLRELQGRQDLAGLLEELAIGPRP